MKKVLSLFTSLFLVFSLNAQIKNYVGIVRQQYHSDTVSLLEDYKSELKEQGYSTYSKAIDGFLEGGFGSGFVYVDANGNNYVVTNLHVVSQADTCSIEFENEDGSYTKYDNLKVLSSSSELDLALLTFDNERPFTKGLKLSSDKIYDGDTVWSAGFPGLGNDPVWQLGKGTITNAHARIKDLIDPSITTIIQHSAQVDSGNSGGPLMIKDSSSVAGYRVVGINTWKASFRQETNFAIPSQTILKFIDDAINNKTENNKALVEKDINSFIKDITNSEKDFIDINKYISYGTVGKKAIDTLLEIDSKAPTSVRSVVLDTFSYNPIEGIKLAVAWETWKLYRSGSEELPIVTIKEITESEDGVFNVVLNNSILGSDIKSIWIKEHGSYRMSNPNTSKKVAKKEKSNKVKDNTIRSFDDEGLMFFVTGNIIPKHTELSSFGIDISTSIGSSWRVGAKFDVGKRVATEFATEKKENLITLYPCVYAEFPIAITVGSWTFTPFVNAGLCTYTTLKSGDLGFGLNSDVGARVGYNFGSISVFVKANYEYTNYFFNSKTAYKENKHGIKVSLGLAF